MFDFACLQSFAWLALPAQGLALAAAEADGGAGAALAPFLRLAGRMHAMVVHFPIALLFAALAFEAWAWLRAPRTAEPRVGPASPHALPCLLLAALGAIVAAWFGWLNAAHEGQRDSDPLVFWHRWLGVGVASLATLTLLSTAVGRWFKARWTAGLFRVGVFASTVLVAIGGHLGGSLVYGEDYLFAVFEAPRPVASTDRRGARGGESESTGASGESAAVLFERDIAPIFEQNCIHCHGPQRQRAGLRLDVLAEILAHDSVVVPGKAEESELARRISLPADDLDAMPPDGERLDEAQIAQITRWIDGLAPPAEPQPTASGASSSDAESLTAGADEAVGRPPADPAKAAAPAEPRPTATSPHALRRPSEPAAPPEPTLTAAQRAAAQSASARIVERGGRAAAIAANSQWLDVNLSLLSPPARDEDLQLLSGLEPVLLWLNLEGSQITDDGARGLNAFTHLSKLNLARTAVGDASLAALAGMPNLRMLVLYGTRVTDAGLASVPANTPLRQLYLWKTAVTPAAAAALRARIPELAVNDGLDPDALATGTPAVPPASPLPPCCAAAKGQGQECDHPCCVAARAQGQICEKCSKP